ncbi:MAG: HipA domain-containing protein [bacterium]|nr:HipA domain-containing protein [bacterium]
MAEGNHNPVPAITEYAELDVSDWPRSGREELGTKPKRWLTNPDTQERWLMKYATFNEPHGSPGYRKGDDWAERVAYGVARVLGIPAALVELAVERTPDEIRYGTVCRSVLQEGESLINGDELMWNVGISVSHHRRELYTVEAAARALRDVDPPSNADEGLSAWDVFVGYLVLDALIGNTDRHEENWSAIKLTSLEGQHRLAPTFDHASSLGFQLSDQQKQERLTSRDSNFTPEGWADRAKTRFADRSHPVEVVGQARALDGQPAFVHWLGRVQQLDDLVAPIWQVTERRMSDLSKEFAERMLRRNWSRLSL